jgi:hypothetical protein
MRISHWNRPNDYNATAHGATIEGLRSAQKCLAPMRTVHTTFVDFVTLRNIWASEEFYGRSQATSALSRHAFVAASRGRRNGVDSARIGIW